MDHNSPSIQHYYHTSSFRRGTEAFFSFVFVADISFYLLLSDVWTFAIPLFLILVLIWFFYLLFWWRVTTTSEGIYFASWCPRPRIFMTWKSITRVESDDKYAYYVYTPTMRENFKNSIIGFGRLVEEFHRRNIPIKGPSQTIPDRFLKGDIHSILQGTFPRRFYATSAIMRAILIASCVLLILVLVPISIAAPMLQISTAIFLLVLQFQFTLGSLGLMWYYLSNYIELHLDGISFPSEIPFSNRTFLCWESLGNIRIVNCYDESENTCNGFRFFTKDGKMVYQMEVMDGLEVVIHAAREHGIQLLLEV